MGELKNFPFKLQEHSPTMDGKPDENKDLNCVQTCIAAGLQYFTGKEYEPDEVKDATYGQGYVGCTSAVNDVAYCSQQGVKLYAISGNPDFLVAQAHEQLAQGHVVIVTVPVNYLPPKDRFNPGMSHAVALYKDSPGVLIAMNPLQAIAQANTDAWWSARLCFNQIWIMGKGTMSGIPQGWKDDGKTLVAPNGFKVVLGFRSWVMAHNWNPADVPCENEHDSTQVFMSRRLKWNAQRGVWEEYIGLEFLQSEYELGQKETELAEALAAQKTLQAQVDALKAAPQKDTSQARKELTAIVASLDDVIASL